MTLRYRIALPLAVGILALDQLTKMWVQEVLPLWSGVPIIKGFFNLVHVLNRGAVFGFLNRPDIDWQRYFFICATVLALVIIAHLLHSARKESPPLFAGLGLVCGGAVGNLIDRIRLGHVIDFLDFYVGQHHWPAFNVADCAICVGAFFLIITLYSRS